MLIAIPAVLHVLVLLSLSTAADSILRTVGAAPLSPGGRLALANARIVLMLVASLSTIIVGVALASATVRTLGRLRDAASAAPGILGNVRACAPIPDARGFPPPPAIDLLQPGRPPVVASRPCAGGPIGPPAVALKLVVSHETARDTQVLP